MVMEQITSKATLPRDWPVGTYRVDVFVKDKLCKSVSLLRSELFEPAALSTRNVQEEFTIANM